MVYRIIMYEYNRLEHMDNNVMSYVFYINFRKLSCLVCLDAWLD